MNLHSMCFIQGNDCLMGVNFSLYQGGFDMICSGRDKIETPEQVSCVCYFADFV